MEEPEPASVLGLRSTFRPKVLVVENVIGPVNPLTGVIVMVDVPWLPALRVRLVGLAVMLKSTTLTVITTVCTSGPLVAVTVTV